MGCSMAWAGLWLMLPVVAVSGENCQRQADVVIDLVAAKPLIRSGMEAQGDDPAVEGWKLLLLVQGELLTDAGVPDPRQEEIARAVMDIDYSDNPEVEVNIFEDYLFLSCGMASRGSAYRPLPDIPKQDLLQCWQDAASREQFQECLAPLIRDDEVAG